MNLYIAGIYASHFGRHGNLYRRCIPNVQMLRDSVTHHLESYHYVKKGSYLEHIRRDQIKVFLDSGAFSAFSLGVEVDIGAYAEFIHENKDVIEMASVLDAIGDHEQTFENQKDLERRGCAVLPCFHYGEPFDLCRYYASNYEYITIGGMVPIPNNKLKPWLDEVWEHCLTDKDGYAVTKVHGFGLTARELMLRYPWYSVDSSSWVQAAANGSIILPEIDSALAISSRSPQVKNFGGHFNTLPETSQRYVEDLLEYYGLTLDVVQNDYRSRWALNAFTFDRLGKLLGEDHWRKPFKMDRQILFAS